MCSQPGLSSQLSPSLLAEPGDVHERPRGLDDPRYPHGHQRPDQERKELVGGLLPERGAREAQADGRAGPQEPGSGASEQEEPGGQLGTLGTKPAGQHGVLGVSAHQLGVSAHQRVSESAPPPEGAAAERPRTSTSAHPHGAVSVLRPDLACGVLSKGVSVKRGRN